MNANSETLNIIAYQSNIVWENPQENLSKVKSIINLSQGSETQALFLPEMFTTGFAVDSVRLAERMDGYSMNEIRRLASDCQWAICGSLIIEENAHYFNRLIWADPSGTIAHYDKKHLFSMGGENNFFSSGQNKMIFEFLGWKIRPAVCYDLRFPVWLRNIKKNEGFDYDLLFVCANWPSSRSYQWKQLLIARAIENQSYVLAVNRVGTDGRNFEYSGGSILINPLGEVLVEMGSEEVFFEAQLSKSFLDKARERFPFANDWDSFTLK